MKEDNIRDSSHEFCIISPRGLLAVSSEFNVNEARCLLRNNYYFP